MARHKEFDRHRVLEKAMNLFWQQGYAATSMQDLVEATGINRQSIYDTFGDKHSLFLATLEKYRQTRTVYLQELLEQPGPALAAIESVFRVTMAQMVAEQPRRACLMMNSAVELAPHDLEVALYTSQNFSALQTAFYKALVKAQAQGEISPKPDLQGLAWFLVCNLEGLHVLSKTQLEPAQLDKIVTQLLQVLS
jgi:TetR/AcrR family transcriptional repressor of nem operon